MINVKEQFWSDMNNLLRSISFPLCPNISNRVYTIDAFLTALWYALNSTGSVPVDFLRPKFRVAHTKDDVISILMLKYTNTNMYIIKKIISCRFIL